MTNITISHEFVNEIQMVVEDAIEFTIREFAKEGELISGESAWKVLEALAVAKQAQFRGEVIWFKDEYKYLLVLSPIGVIIKE